MANEKIISMHIEKTGGTSMMRFFCDLYGPENVYFYHPRVGFKRQDQDSAYLRRTVIGDVIKDIVRRCPRIYRTIRASLHRRESKSSEYKVPQNFSVIHGHFSYGDICVPGAMYVTVLREPLQRNRSHFDDVSKWNGVVYTPSSKLSYSQFAFHESLVNFHAKRIGVHGLKPFSYVGMTERLEEYCRLFDPYGRVRLQKLNKSLTPSVSEPQHDFLSRFMNTHALDYKLYSEASERFINYAGNDSLLANMAKL